MHDPARTGDLAMIRLLIARGVSVHTGTATRYSAPSGPTPLQVAQQAGQSVAVELLRANGAH
jgi:hypothetical protein